ncbi:unnamed protein product, partial [Musa textilis]
ARKIPHRKFEHPRLGRWVPPTETSVSSPWKRFNGSFPKDDPTKP